MVDIDLVAQGTILALVAICFVLYIQRRNIMKRSWPKDDE